MTSLQKLREECKALGLSTGGNRAQISERLKAHKAQAPTGDCTRPGCEHVNSIIVNPIEYQDDDGMVTEARVALRTASENDEIQPESIRGSIFVGNQEGLRFAEQYSKTEAIEQELLALKESFRAAEEKRDAEREKRDAERDNLMNLVDNLTNLVEMLQQGNTTLMEMRNRFISTFKRDKTTSQLDLLDRGWISSGNVIAHAGSSKFDSTLYNNKGRQDIGVYKQLYGLHPAIVATSKLTKLYI